MKLVSIPANPVPDDVVTGAIQTPDGVNLRFARWAPPPGRKGTVLVLQGRAEFIEKYFETVRDLRARGFAVVTFDWRGQGLSDRALSNRHKGYVRSFSNFITDLEAVMEQVVLPDCPPPIFALAHSMMLSVTEQSDGVDRIADDCFDWFAGRHSDDGSCRRLVGEVRFDCVIEPRPTVQSQEQRQRGSLLLLRWPDIPRVKTRPRQSNGKNGKYGRDTRNNDSDIHRHNSPPYCSRKR